MALRFCVTALRIALHRSRRHMMSASNKHSIGAEQYHCLYPPKHIAGDTVRQEAPGVHTSGVGKTLEWSFTAKPSNEP